MVKLKRRQGFSEWGEKGNGMKKCGEIALKITACPTSASKLRGKGRNPGEKRSIHITKKGRAGLAGCGK